MKTPGLAALQVFVAVAERRSFTGAAARLGVSPSAVSQSIRALESHVGQPLLRRTTRSVSLTEAGEALLRDGGSALDQAQLAIERASAAQRPVGRLRLTVPRIAVGAVLAEVMPVFVEELPGAVLEVSVEDRLVDIVAERFDAGIRFQESLARDMIAVRLTQPFRFVVVGAPAFLEKHGRPRDLDDLKRFPCMTSVSPTTGAPYDWELEDAGRTRRIPVTGPVLTASRDLLLRGALAGVGLAYVSELACAAHVARGELEIVLRRFAPQEPGLFLYYPSRAQRRPVLDAFLAIAKRTLRPRR